MSMNEIKKLYVVQQVEDKKLTGSEAAQHVKLSLRQVRRLVAKYRWKTRNRPGEKRPCTESSSFGRCGTWFNCLGIEPWGIGESDGKMDWGVFVPQKNEEGRMVSAGIE